ncbi:MAG: hypothetical protein KAR32_09265 [Candidatus Omnitrophica bacterium]|nr:hypothetical protein [Candidatus Omnitrophota bacterium]
MRNRSGQNVIEYILLFVLVVSLLVIVLGPNGAFTRKIDGALNAAIDGMETEVRRN